MRKIFLRQLTDYDQQKAVAITNEILTENFIAEQGATGVDC